MPHSPHRPVILCFCLLAACPAADLGDSSTDDASSSSSTGDAGVTSEGTGTLSETSTSAASGPTTDTATGPDGSTGDSGNQEGSDTMPDPEDDTTMVDFLETGCPWAAACSDMTLEECFSALDGDHTFPNNLRAAGLTARTECTRAANSCADYSACVPAGGDLFSGLEGDVDGQTCPKGQDSICLEDSDTFIWCPFENDDTAAEVRDLSLDGLACFGHVFRDEPPVPCEQTTCDGSILRDCYEGFTVSADCAFTHPAFECEHIGEKADFGFVCALPTPTCESNSFTNSGGSARCQDNDFAVVCMSGLELRVSCAAVGGTCQDVGDYDATCV